MPPSDDRHDLVVDTSRKSFCASTTAIPVINDDDDDHDDHELRSIDLKDGGNDDTSLKRPQGTLSDDCRHCTNNDDDDDDNDEDECIKPVVTDTGFTKVEQESSSKREMDEENEERTDIGNYGTGIPQTIVAPPNDDSYDRTEQGLPLTEEEDVIAARRWQQDEAVRESTKAEDSNGLDPLKILRKGAVAAVGGTMVGVGLIMIPLPTPFGVVVASSGMMVLGTEFDGAKEMHERIIVGAKETAKVARDHIVRTIESMEYDESDTDASKIDRDIQTTGVPVNCKDADAASIIINTFDSADGNVALDDPSPSWLHMNSVEQERQENLAKEKYRRENQTAFDQTKQYLTKSAVAFLSKNVLPLLNFDDTTADDEKIDGSEDTRRNHDDDV